MKKIFSSTLYELSLYCLAFLVILRMLFQKLFKGKYKENLFSRFGKGFPKISNEGKLTVWAHAVSLGETKAIIPLLRLFKKKYPDSILIFSTITETGQREAKKAMPEADYHLFLPFDFKWKMRQVLKNVKIDFLFLSETDFWYNFLNEAKKTGTKIFLVNGKISLRSMSRFQKLSFFTSSLFSLFDHLYVQSPLYAERFQKIGVPKAKISPMGNMKLDGEVSPMQELELYEIKQRFKIQKQQKVIVVGSTHHPEEKQLISIFKKLWIDYPTLKVILVPRHPERFKDVAALIAKENIPFISYSRLDQADGNEKVILIDAMGLLKVCYQIADIAIVAGSYTAKVGGHNILEPSFYGKPVIYGPHHYSQPDLVVMMEQFQAGKEVPLEKLENVLKDWLDNPEKAQEIGKKGFELLKHNQGVVTRIWHELEKGFLPV